MHCVSCGHENELSARFCGGCGLALLIDCSACGKTNAAGNRFCDGCGSTLHAVSPQQPRSYTPAHLAQKILTTRSALEGERKQVTVLFCDLANSTEMAQKLGPELMHDTLNAFFEIALAEVHRVEGTINQFLGDGFMALFGAPLAHEDHVLRALHSVLAIQRRLQEAAAVAGSSLAQVKVRMGVNTGSVVVGRIGDNLRMDYTAVGDATHIAARLQQFAAPGAVCVSDAVQAVGRDQFEFASQGVHALKGVAKRVEIFTLVRAQPRDDVGTEGRSRAHLGRLGVASPLVGRNAELSSFESALDALGQGRGSLIVLEGEPGVGKSRLMAEIRRRCSGGSALWLEGRSLSFGRHLSYWPFIQLLKSAFGISEDDAEERSWAKLERGLQSLFGQRATEVLPYLATVMALPMAPGYEDRLQYLDGPGLRRQVFLCVRQLVELMAQRQPLIVALEDWHWADQSSVDLAEHLLPLCQSAPVLLIFPTRDTPEGPTRRVRDFAAAHPAMQQLDVKLAPLTPQDSALLVANLAGSLNLPLELRDRIQLKTGGNPFFIEEIIRSLITEGALVRDSATGSWKLVRRVDDVMVPDTLQGLILARIDRLRDDAKQTLKLASVIGRSFYDRVLVALSEAGDQMHQYLNELELAELIREKQRQPELEYIFKHALVQEAAYGSILADNRRNIHRRVARAIEVLFPERLDEFASLLAHHYTCAEDWDKAQVYLFKAGEQAGRMAADAEALEHLRRAESAYVKANGNKLAPLERAALARKVGAALFGTGQYAASHEHMRRALEELDIDYPASRGGVLRAVLGAMARHFWRHGRRWVGLAAGRSMNLADAAEASTILHTMSWTDYFLDKECMLLDSLLELQVGECSAYALAEARGLSSVGFGFMTVGARGIARRYHRRALLVAKGTGNPSAVAFAQMAAGFLDFYEGDGKACVEQMSQSMASYREAGDLHRWGASALMKSWAQIALGEVQAACELSAEVARSGRDSADPQKTSWGCQSLGSALLIMGRFAEAEVALAEGADAARRVLSWDNMLHLRGHLVRCLVLQGRLEECEPLLKECHAILAREKLPQAFDRVELMVAEATYRLALAESLPVEGRAEALQCASKACSTAMAYARKMPLWLPGALRLMGLLDWLGGNTVRANRHWQEGVALAQRLAMPVEQGLLLLEIGRRTGRAEYVRDSAALFRQTGAWAYLSLAEPGTRHPTAPLSAASEREAA